MLRNLTNEVEQVRHEINLAVGSSMESLHIRYVFANDKVCLKKFSMDERLICK